MNLRVAVSGKAEGLQPLRRSESEPEEGVFSRRWQTRNQVIYTWPG